MVSTHHTVGGAVVEEPWRPVHPNTAACHLWLLCCCVHPCCGEPDMACTAAKLMLTHYPLSLSDDMGAGQ